MKTITQKKSVSGLVDIKKIHEIIQNNLPDLVFVFDKKLTYLHCSYGENGQKPAMPVKTFIGKRVSEFFPKWFNDLLRTHINTVLATKKELVFEYQLPPLNSKDDGHFFSCRLYPFEKDQVLALIRDITEQVQTQKEIQSRLKRDHMLSEISQTLISKSTLQDKLNKIIRQLSGLMAELVMISRITDDKKYIERVAAYHPQKEFLEFVQSLKTKISSGFGQHGKVFSSGKPIFIPYTTPEKMAAMNARRKKVFKKFPVYSSLYVPIILNKEVKGILSMAHTTKDNHFSDEDLGILERVASRLALAFESDELYHKMEDELAVRKEIEKQLLHSRELYRSVIANLPNAAVTVCDLDLKLLFADGPIYQRKNIDTSLMLGKTLKERWSKKIVDLVEPNYRATLLGSSREFEFNFDGIKSTVYTKPLYDLQGKINGLISFMLDRSDELNNQQRIMSAIVEGQDMERKRLAEELHDGLGQVLSAINLHARHIKSRVDKTEQSKNIDFNPLSALIDKAIHEVRTISHDISPMPLYDFDLSSSLQDLADQSSVNAEVKITMKSDIGKHKLEKNIEIGIYRIAQELINNAIKHAHATRILINLSVQDGKIIFSVKDDGIGFLNTKKKNKGIGLYNVKMRSQSLNGVFTIDSSAGVGTSATVQIPFRKTN